MNKIRTNITIDPRLKLEASKIFEQLGLDFSTAISLFLKQVVVNEGLPFEITTSKNSILHKYKQLKDLIEEYFGFKDAKYTPINKIMSKQDMIKAKKEYEKIKSGKIKFTKYSNFIEGLKDLGIEI